MKECTCEWAKGSPYLSGMNSRCWLYQNREDYRQKWGQCPTKRRQKWLKFLIALLRHAQNWFQRVSRQEYKRRLALCRSCPHYVNVVRERCGKCGCRLSGLVLAKAKWKSESCPVGRW